MPHADSAKLPDGVESKNEFWEHVRSQLASLLTAQRNWVSNTANASSLIYNALESSQDLRNSKSVNWAGFYIHGSLFPGANSASTNDKLLLGPFHGKPACQYIQVAPANRARGVCAEAYLQAKTIIVPDVEAHPSHIACDGDTKSEIVVPLILNKDNQRPRPLGVLDLDCVELDGFSEEDRVGLEKIAQLIVDASDWE